ncbi:hypothetical protein PANT_6c00009 [Moesziomyces antarcticus T-34]|uniref:EthD domain-containing protein n=1 Tax=Pseudozyma antarctica (strain T-34) TaxID=1151754 RepID=M9MAW6_PSEA3|nr:hypothetical protein PANT_6c00009 [Moesziomyces antarcticus T-34]
MQPGTMQAGDTGPRGGRRAGIRYHSLQRTRAPRVVRGCANDALADALANATRAARAASPKILSSAANVNRRLSLSLATIATHPIENIITITTTTIMASASAPGKWARVFKVSIYLKKKDGISDQEFSDYYAQTHAALAGPVLLRHNCISYTQFHHMTEKARDSTTSIFGPDALSPQNPMQPIAYDGCSSFVFASIDDARGFFHDPETAQILGPDSVNFTNTATLQVAIGDEFVAIQDGKPAA